MGVKQTLQSITILDRAYTKWKWRERRISRGDMYPDTTFFVVRRAYCKVGLFSYVMTNMGLVDHAIGQGYIPVIDMQNGRNTYLEEDKVGRENAWEYYFKQPCGYSLEDIGKAKNIILSDGLITDANNYPDFRIVDDLENFSHWHAVFEKYLKVNDEINREFDILKRKYLGDSKVLGILARGTDYVSSEPPGHPVQPTASQIIEKAREVMKKYSCGKIYLATEDADIYSELKNAFGDQLVAPATERYTTKEGQNINDFRKDHDKRLKGKEYLLSILLLSACDCLIAGNVGGTHGAMLMSKGYEYQHIFRLGKYSERRISNVHARGHFAK